MFAKRLLVLAASTAILAGCGTHVTPTALPVSAAASQAKALAASTSLLASIDKEEPDNPVHQAMNKIVADVLSGMFAQLLQSADADHNGAISLDEYAKGHSADAAQLFKTFDANNDGVVNADEYAAAAASDAMVTRYHHFTEEAMEKAIAPYTADKAFTSQELRTYMVNDLGLHGDWPMIFKLLKKLDLNNDGKLLNSTGEGPAFMLTFARQQMQHALGLALTPVDTN